MDSLLLEKFCTFLEGYNAFLLELEQLEQSKNTALAMWDLPAIDKAIAEQQATLMKLSKLEDERAALQAQLGMPGATLAEIAQAAAQHNAAIARRLQGLFAGFTRSVSGIKKKNERSMLQAKQNLQLNQKMGATAEGEGAYNARHKKEERAPSLFQAQI